MAERILKYNEYFPPEIGAKVFETSSLSCYNVGECSNHFYFNKTITVLILCFKIIDLL